MINWNWIYSRHNWPKHLFYYIRNNNNVNRDNCISYKTCNEFRQSRELEEQ